MTTRKDTHGEDVGLLGFGMMRLPTLDGGHADNFSQGVSERAIDEREVCAQVDYALQHGVNYFDTSPVYCKGQSEEVTGRALNRHPREKWKVATKLSNFAPETQSAEKSRAMYEKSHRLLNVEKIDYYLLHAVGMGGFAEFEKRYVKNGMIDFLAKERERGRIGNLGFSYHGDRKAWDWLMERHDKYHWDFVQIQLNYADWKHAQATNKRNLNAEYLYGECAKRNIPVVIMEPLLGGRLAKQSAALVEVMTEFDAKATPASWALRFAAQPKMVMTVLSGMTYMAHLKENCALYSPFKPLSEAELAALERTAVKMLGEKSIPCNMCNYCMPCPFGLDIPLIFSTRNAAFNGNDGETNNFLREYERKIPKLRAAERCIECGECKKHCPQEIDIPAEMLKIEDLVEALRARDIS